MSKLSEQILRIEDAYAEVDRETAAFARESDLGCPDGCGACCTDPNVEATVSELLPMAETVWRAGRAEEVIAWIEDGGEGSACFAYQASSPDGRQGKCGFYESRPLVCRLFGFSGNPDKRGTLRPALCWLMQSETPDDCQRVKDRVRGEMTIPDGPAHAMKLFGETGDTLRMPINQAIRKAIDRVYLARLEG
ncbi:MAG: hypothetical protein CME19_07940 [Gemmatimonadetes bacterium]|nr:hypothetical protein [Gemmatimonadota bacterium]|tara:strand:- start:313 stop:888 length:576 start_codon:yes stop_codon:yes gene_type:complete